MTRVRTPEQKARTRAKQSTPEYLERRRANRARKVAARTPEEVEADRIKARIHQRKRQPQQNAQRRAERAARRERSVGLSVEEIRVRSSCN